MHVAGMILGCLLLGQTPNAGLATPTAPSRLRPPEMVADAIRLPTGSTVSGQPLSLLSVLASTPDRRQQLELTRPTGRWCRRWPSIIFAWSMFKTLAASSPLAPSRRRCGLPGRRPPRCFARRSWRRPAPSANWRD